MLNKTSFPQTHNTSLKKNERIHSRKDIGLLFSNKAYTITGSIITLKLARIEDVDGSSSTSRKIFISVPKKKIKRAVDRNKIKRHIREIYRNNKNLFPIKEGTILLVGFVYNTKEIYGFNTLKEEIIDLCSNYSKCDDINNKSTNTISQNN